MKQTITSITALILGFTSIFLGLSLTKLHNEISRLEKQVELNNDAKTTLLRKIIPISGFTYYTVYTDKEGQVQYYMAH